MDTCLTKKDITPFFSLASHFMTFFFGHAHKLKCCDFLDKKMNYLKISTLFVFCLSFGSFSYCFAAVIDLLLSLLPVQKFLRKYDRDRKFSPMEEENLALRIFVHIWCSIDPITFIWVSLERSFPFAEFEYMWCNLNFIQRWWCQNWNKGQRLSQVVTGTTGINEKMTDWEFLWTRIKWL